MQVIIHRGTHQIGGIATEIRTNHARIVIDMGDELNLDEGSCSKPLEIPGVTDNAGLCHALLLTHIHADHVGQIKYARDDIPLYMGELAKEIYLAAMPQDAPALKSRILRVKLFVPGRKIQIGDILITPFSIDHSACDSYMFLIEADGKTLLYTGDFRLHGFRGKAVPKILMNRISHVDALIVEGTTLSRNESHFISEADLQRKAKEYMEQYKYVFVLCASTNLERICALSKAVPRGKYFVCDDYQKKLLNLIQEYWGKYSDLYRNLKITSYGSNLLTKLKDKGFVMMVRDNHIFREIIKQFNKEQSIILYSMWDGYRTKQNSSIPSFLDLVDNWEPLHTSGHASQKDIKAMIDMLNPDVVIPIHTDAPHALTGLCNDKTVVVLKDGEVYDV